MGDRRDSIRHEEANESGKVIQRRRRPPLSCTECRRRKLKCDRSLPCGQCVRSKTAESCVFSGIQPGELPSPSHRISNPISRPQLPSGQEEQLGNASGMFVFDSKMGPKKTSNRVTKNGHHDELQELRQRLRTLERALAKPGSALQTPETSVHDTFSEVTTSQNSVEGTCIDERVLRLPDCSFRGKKGKTRYCGRSHYCTTISFFRDIGTFMRCSHRSHKDKEYSDMKKFKCELWSRESQEHQRAFREQAFNLEEMVPTRAIADQLLQLYLNTFETTYRILHIPTFLKQYADFWANPQKRDMMFVAQLLAILATGSRFYSNPPQTSEEDLDRVSAKKWIMAVQSYISSTFVSPEINLKMIQTETLLLVARIATGHDGDVAWASAGALIRSAMTMGLHRDPTRFRKTKAPFWSELRRRIWNTIVEIDLHLSLDRGVVPTIDLDQCDCDAPSNWDDSELFDNMEDDPTSLSTAAYTSNFYQCLLLKTLELRYRITRKINSLRFDLSYDEALRMSEDLFRAMKNASDLFDDNASGIGPCDLSRHQFAQSLHLFTMRRIILTLHRPFSLSVARSPKCSYSRKVCLEKSLEILSQMDLPSSTDPFSHPYFPQLRSGMLCDETFHAALTVCVELALQAQEIRQPSGTTMEGMNASVLQSMVQSQQTVMLQAVERSLDGFGRGAGGGTGQGTKPYFFLSLILASVKSRIKGEDPFPMIEEASKRAVRVGRGMTNGLSYDEALTCSDRPPLPPAVSLNGPIETTPLSASSIEFDFPSLFAADLGDFAPLDLGGWFDGLDSRAGLWDNNLFTDLPQI